MQSTSQHKNPIHNSLSLAGVIISLGIVFGDIGTSPLYVMKAITGELNDISQETIFGAISCIFWTLTIQTTIKYVLITLRANNNGEGGIFALFALIRKRFKWTYLFALVGGSTLLADGIITPSITVTSAIEGLHTYNNSISVLPIVITILSILFFIQQFGTSSLGSLFGPIMFIWFFMLFSLGFTQLIEMPAILQSLNPIYAFKLLVLHPGGFWLLGAVFLATTGAEALYSDLGHCGMKNIQISWIYVKIALVVTYLGQGVWILKNPILAQEGVNPFFGIMPSWFLVPGIILATAAAIIASQALISGSFTLISEAISLNFWPKTTIKYPSEVKGQMYIPNLNTFLWASCIAVVLYFETSSAMEAAYGLSISITMLMTTVLLIAYLSKKTSVYVLILLGLIFFTVEISFLWANLSKFSHGGWFTIFLASIFAIIMYVWYNARRLKNRQMKYEDINPFIRVLKEIKQDESIPQYATNLVYLTKANTKNQIESTIKYSLFQKQPKRADIYWFLFVDIKDEPYTFEYEITHYEKNEIIKIDFHLGFKIEPKIHLYFKQIIEDLVDTDGLNTLSRHPSLLKNKMKGDFKYITIDRVLTSDTYPYFIDKLIMNLNSLVRFMAISEAKAYQIDPCNHVSEKIPLDQHLRRIFNLKRISSKES